MRRLEIQCDPANLSSAAIPAKLGFIHQVTIAARVHVPDAEPRDTMIWAMDRRAWPGSPAAVHEAQWFDVDGRRLPSGQVGGLSGR